MQIKRASKRARSPTVSRPELLTEDGSDGDFRRLVEGLLPFLGIHTAIRDSYASLLGLPGPQYTILLCIRNLEAAGAVNVTTIASTLRQSGSFITAETNALEQKGLLRKERGGEDRRKVCISLTSSGGELLDSIASLRQQVNDVQFGCLSREEFQMLVPLVDRLVQSGERALALLNYLKSHDADESPAASAQA
jgi:MarR family transcriptional regulator, organic hydroperoxide resistance regulator